MFARLTLLEIDTVRVPMDAALRVYLDEVLPEVRSQPGYAGVLVLTTPEGGGALVSFWDTPEAADASATTGFYPELLDRYLTMFRSPPGRERYEVQLAELATATPT